MKIFGLLFRLCLCISVILITSFSFAATPNGCLSDEEAELVQLINTYRNDNGLPSVPVSVSLTLVGQWHVIDLHENTPDTGTDHGLSCNMHSWSNAKPTLWGAVCYTDDHQYSQAMWDKPGEITSGVYSDNGYENAYESSGQATAAGAFDGWKTSPAHNAVILEEGIWSGRNWPAMGVGIYEHHAVLWFGDQTDPQGSPEACANGSTDNGNSGGGTGDTIGKLPLPAILELLRKKP